MIQIEEPDYYIKIGIKNDKVVNVDWTGMPDTKDLILWKVIGFLKSAIELINPITEHSSDKPKG
jgi:hypothetical protein